MDYAIEVVTPNAALPVTTNELAEHLRLNSADDSTLLGYYIETATRLFESRTGRTISPTVYRQWVNSLPTELQRSPVSAVSGVTYYDSSDNAQSLTTYRADTFQTPTPVYTTTQPYGSWLVPTDVLVGSKRRYTISVTFTAGYSSIPADIKTAVLLCAAHLWAHRGDDEAELPPGFLAICHKYAVRGYAS